MLQAILAPATDGDNLHTLTRQGRRNCDWGEYHHQYLQMWENRRNLVLSAPLHDEVATTPDYKRWYERNTILLISPYVRGVGFRPGDARFRRLVSDEAAVLMNNFQDMSLRDQPPYLVAEMQALLTLDDDYTIWQIGRSISLKRIAGGHQRLLEE